MQRDWWASLFLHFLLIGPLVVLSFLNPTFKQGTKEKKISFEVIEKPEDKPKTPPPPPKPIKLEPVKKTIQQKKAKPKPAPSKAKPQAPPKEVFGISGDTLTTDTPSASAVTVKEGNTVVKEVDAEKLDPKDKNRAPLPKPKPTFLVSQMPVLIKEKKPVYPKAAKDKGIEATVKLKVLIDEDGKVRAVDVLDDPGYGMGEKAKEAMFLHEFKPAKIENEAVPVEIRYAITFSLL